jgi:hypothetical protein
VAFEVSAGSATVNSDFVLLTPSPVPFLRGQTTAVINISLVDDTAPELEEGFNVTLLGAAQDDADRPLLATSPSLGPRLVTQCVIDSNDDAAGVFSFLSGDITVAETAGVVTLTVSRSDGALSAVVLQVCQLACVPILLSSNGQEERRGGQSCLGSALLFLLLLPWPGSAVERSMLTPALPRFSCAWIP